MHCSVGIQWLKLKKRIEPDAVQFILSVEILQAHSQRLSRLISGSKNWLNFYSDKKFGMFSHSYSSEERVHKNAFS